MLRREFIAGLAGAVASPLAARSQQGERLRRIAVLIYGAENDPVAQAYAAAIRDGLSTSGWTEGRNLRTDLRFVGDAGAIRTAVDGAVSLAPDVIVAHTGPVLRAVQQRTKIIPIVLLAVGDPVGNGYVANLSRPEGNTTGITNLFFSIAGKWVDLLKEAVPRLERVALIYHSVFNLAGYWAAIEAAAPKLSLRAVKIPIGDVSEIEHAIDAFAVGPNGGLIVGAQPNIPFREAMFRQAKERRLPTLCNERIDITQGGLMFYGPNHDNLFRRAGYFVDRILRGARASELPVEFPTKFDLVINLRIAKAIGLTIPELFLLRADEVIE
jgi:putative ABC transport system substrate-binding protein